MAGDTYPPLISTFVRTFLIENGARADRSPEYHNCMMPGAIDHSLGDITSIKSPHPTRAGDIIEVAITRGASERPTTSLIGRYPSNIASRMKELYDKRCANDYHFNIGDCEDVSLFNKFQKKIIFEDGPITNYSTDDFGTLDGEGTPVNETIEISGKRWYEVLGLNFGEKAGDLVTNQVIDVIICDNISCGDCDDPSNGCEKIFALTTAAGGSPGTPPDIVYSLDKGVNWFSVDIDTMAPAEVPNALACVGDYIVVISNETNSAHYAEKSDFTTSPSVTWTEVTTGFVIGGEPNDIWSIGNLAWIVGDGGYIYTMTDATAGVTVIDAGTVDTDNLQAVHAISENKMVAVGENGVILTSENGSTISAVTSPVGVGITLFAVWVKSNNNKEWWIGGNGGNRLYSTVDNGISFVASTFSGSAAGTVRDIAFSSKSVGYIAHDTATPAGRIFKTTNAGGPTLSGSTWIEASKGASTIPANDQITALAACEDDVNLIIGVGLADNATDGIILIGED